ncbi:STAS domain-containing protein [Streptomyces sp. SP17BM10]|uniref:STAS domain-containing protein n=1 Tax=Streptomyces sp. SP17BM10 TaxID=3002530 RepID=UPI002E79B922|nr:STAS domain-containing protein [Streptomyces sp. SP17BM10]MEE1787047.1 STAS domain-containing protein [Streptomyces sp. SP17BM10]
MPQAVEGESGPGPGGLRIAVDRAGPVRIVALAGELDHDTADGLRTVLDAPRDDGVQRLVVDLADLRFCDSTGLNILLRARLDAEATGLRVELAGPQPVVERLFAITGADGVFLIHPDLGAALKEQGPDGRGAGPASGPA